jgi:Mrp family chromosome partitioning ATPase
VMTRRDGLPRLLTRQASLEEALVPARNHPRLRLLLSSREQLPPLQLVQRDGWRDLLDTLESHADIVIIDTPPLPEVAEALSFAAAAEAVIVTVRLGHTRRESLLHLRELLTSRGISPLGFVVTTRERPGAGTYYDYTSDYAAPGPATPAGRDKRQTPRAVRMLEE